MSKWVETYVEIPPEFWEPFGVDESEVLKTHEAGGGIVHTLRDGRQTFQRWSDGTFAVRQPDGTVEQYHGIEVNVADLMREFPPPTVQ